MTAPPLGIDFAWTKPDPRAVAAAGYRFVLGYLSGGGTKDLTGPLVAAYRAAGLMVGLVWETTAQRALAGGPAGSADGAAADRQATAIGYPADAVLFAAVDFGATTAQINGPIRDYMHAFSAATARPVGVYGSYYVVTALCTPGRAPVGYAWQTMAWSNSQLWPSGHLFQRLAHTHPIAGVQVTDWDEDVLLNPLPLYGAPQPTPAPKPAPTPAPEVDMQASDPLTWTDPDTGQTQTFTVSEWITWGNIWAQRALAAANAAKADVDALAAKPAPAPQLDPAAVTAWLDANSDAIAGKVADLVVAQLGQRLDTPPAA